jgi:hypothetical protein
MMNGGTAKGRNISKLAREHNKTEQQALGGEERGLSGID